MSQRQPKNEIDPRILQPGRGGLLTLAEAEYIRDTLASDGRLRRRWGLEDRTRFPLGTIAALAFPENPRAAREHIREQQQRESGAQPETPLRHRGKAQLIQGVLFDAA